MTTTGQNEPLDVDVYSGEPLSRMRRFPRPFQAFLPKVGPWHSVDNPGDGQIRHWE